MIKQPTALVLDYIDRHYTYDPDTGTISRDGKPTGTLRKDTKYITLSMMLDTTYEGCNLHYQTMAHQVAWYLTHGVWSSMILDHIDGNRSNNRLSNLRQVTSSQNSYNIGKMKKTTSSKFKGVVRVGSRWRAYIHHQGKMLHLGYYLTEEEAAVAYDTKAIEVWGEYAKCNMA